MRECHAEEREPYLSTIVGMLRDEEFDVRDAAAAALACCSAEERAGHMAAVGAMLRDGEFNVQRSALAGAWIYFWQLFGARPTATAAGARSKPEGSVGKVSGEARL